MADPGALNDIVAWAAGKSAAAFSGVCGAYVRHLFPPYKAWRQRLAEYVGGALAAVYGGPVAGPVMAGTLDKVMGTVGVTMGDALPRTNVESLAGFLCGVLGLTLIEGAFILARRWRDNPTIGL